MKCLLLKYKHDCRYTPNKVVTHGGSSMDALSISILAEAQDHSMKYDVIGIDEG